MEIGGAAATFSQSEYNPQQHIPSQNREANRVVEIDLSLSPYGLWTLALPAVYVSLFHFVYLLTAYPFQHGEREFAVSSFLVSHSFPLVLSSSYICDFVPLPPHFFLLLLVPPIYIFYIYITEKFSQAYLLRHAGKLRTIGHGCPDPLLLPLSDLA